MLNDTILAGWLGGASQVADQLPEALAPQAISPALSPGMPSPAASVSPEPILWPPVRPPEPPPPILPLADVPEQSGPPVKFPIIDEAIRNLQERRLVAPDEFYNLGQEARRAAFTVGRTAGLETIQRIHQALDETLREGPSHASFRRKMAAAFDESPLAAGHLENVFRTNVQTALSRGIDAVADQPLVADEFPFEEVIVIPDSRLSEVCEAMMTSGIQGTNIYRRDDPVYRRYVSPRHYQCRCNRRLLSVEQAARRGIREAVHWLQTGQPPLQPTWVAPIKVPLPAGWDSGRPV